MPKTSTLDPHAVPVSQVLSELGTGPHGLTGDQAAERLLQHGKNKLPEGKRTPLLKRILGHFKDPLIYMLVVAAVVLAFTGHWIDTWVIMAVVLVNAAIGFIQEGQAEKALEGLRDLLSASARVRRDNRWQQVPSEGVVVGDVVALAAGDRVPADGRLLEASNLQVEESALTGESIPAVKTVDPVAPDAGIGDQTSMVFSGTLVASGSGRAVITGTGDKTQIGLISQMVSRVETLATPLTQAMSRFGIQLTVVILVAAGLLFGFAWLVHDFSTSELFRAVVSFGVSMIPEGLPAILTITLARGVQIMARRNAITRQLNSVETLGSVTVICSDKTGTLTKNEMTVRKVVSPDAEFRVSGTGYEPKGSIRRSDDPTAVENLDRLQALFEVASRTNEARIQENDSGEWTLLGEPTDGSLRTLALKAGVNPSDADRIAVLPFDSEHKYMATLDSTELGTVIHFKGAPDRILEYCTAQGPHVDETQPLDKTYWEDKITELSGEGLRVLAAAVKKTASSTVTHEDIQQGDFVFLGLYGIIDPPREEAIEAIQKCQDAGVTVKMITGDHAGTALAIGAEMGIGDGKTAVTGSELEEFSDEQLREVVQNVDVFARTSPEHKLRIVTALQANGEVTSMTGDGVNDAPSLRRADVGVAMGLKGTEATKEAADIVLADDNFATIERAVEQGRTIYDNLRKSILFILPTNGAEGLVIVFAILAGLTLPLTPLQILWANMVVGVTLAFALAFERSEPDVMNRPPRPRDAGVLGAAGLVRIVFVTVVVGTLALVAFAANYQHGEGDLSLARTMTVNILVFAQAFYLFNVRFLAQSSLRKELFTTNPVSWLTFGALIILQVIFSYTPFFNNVFESAPLSWQDWGLTLLIGVIVFGAVEIEKWVRRLLGRRASMNT